VRLSLENVTGVSLSTSAKAKFCTAQACVFVSFLENGTAHEFATPRDRLDLRIPPRPGRRYESACGSHPRIVCRPVASRLEFRSSIRRRSLSQGGHRLPRKRRSADWVGRSAKVPRRFVAMTDFDPLLSRGPRRVNCTCRHQTATVEGQSPDFCALGGRGHFENCSK
jgi:hypothetical protein